MKAQLRKFLDALAGAFWTLPLFMLLSAFALAAASLWVDARFSERLPAAVRFVEVSDAQAARRMLGTRAVEGIAEPEDRKDAFGRLREARRALEGA